MKPRIFKYRDVWVIVYAGPSPVVFAPSWEHAMRILELRYKEGVVVR